MVGHEPSSDVRPEARPARRGLRSGLSSWVLHPLFLAAYPVLFLFAQNTADQLTFDPLWVPLALAIAGALVLLLVGRLVFGDFHRAGIATSVVVIGFFSFGHAWNLVGETIGNERILLGAWILAMLAGVVLAWRLGRRARAATGPLNLVAALPLILTLVNLGGFAISRGAAGVVLDPVGGLLDDGAPRPDIYYLVFDRYAGSPTLDRYYGFDNEPFLRELEDRGFAVARDSVANYVKTGLSLTSTLNMDYLDAEELTDAATTPADQRPINRAFQGRLAVPSALQELGYRFVLVPSWWSPTASNVDADVTLRYEGASEFSIGLLETTIVSAFTAPTAEVDPFSASELRNYTRYQLDRIAELPELPGPKLVMAHLLVPHPPYLFDRDGTRFDAADADLTRDERYVRQMEWTNEQILTMIDQIRADTDGEPPVIIIQADEGPFPRRYEANGETFRWADATASELEIKFRIINAIDLPGADATEAGFHPSITSINTFRVVFNALFDADLPMLEERVYAHTDYRHFYDFIDVTDRIPGWPQTETP